MRQVYVKLKYTLKDLETGASRRFERCRPRAWRFPQSATSRRFHTTAADPQRNVESKRVTRGPQTTARQDRAGTAAFLFESSRQTDINHQVTSHDEQPGN